MVSAPKFMLDYFENIEKQVRKELEIAEKAHSLGLDPDKHVDIPIAKDMAERSVGLVSSEVPELKDKNIPERIKELEKQFGANDWRVALCISKEISQEKFCKFKSLEKAIEAGIRVGLAYTTLGIVSAPLEGFVEAKLKKRKDGKQYLACFYAGPIRASGGTAAAVSVLISDYVRKELGIDAYDPSEEEIDRFIIELEDYNDRVSRLQYYPSDDEIKFLVSHLPVELDGDPTTELEVSRNKDLERVESNRIRGGMCLVLGEGLTQKAKKIWKAVKKWGKDFGLDHWSFLEEFIELQSNILAKKTKTDIDSFKIKPNYKIIKDAVAGRPIFSYPLSSGGFRIRYGRTRMSGHECFSINPAGMFLLNDFLATGTQLSVERPGKGCTLSPCECIEGPIVRLSNGDVVKVNTSDLAKKLKGKIDEFLFLGDILINYGGFSTSNHILIPSPYVEEWWVLELKKALESKKTSIPEKRINEFLFDCFNNMPSIDEAAVLSRELSIPLHPKYIYYWNEASVSDIELLSKSFNENKNNEFEGKDFKKVLEKIGCPHRMSGGFVVLNESDLKALKLTLKNFKKHAKYDNALDLINSFSELKIMNKAWVYLGARMGRPEKSKMRKMKGSPHTLFPVGEEGGRLRSFITSMGNFCPTCKKSFDKQGNCSNCGTKLKGATVTAEFPVLFCSNCNAKTVYPKCEICGSETVQHYVCVKCSKEVSDPMHCGVSAKPYERREVNIQYYIDKALSSLGVPLPDLVKGVRGTFNKKRNPEPLEKGILRAMNKVFVNKDGTVRLDMTELPITHFKPCEIGTSVEKLKVLGYAHDIHNNPLVSDDQVLEMFVQDIIVPECTEFPGSNTGTELFKISRFIDDLLEKFYKLPRFYNAKKKEDLIGSLVICLAPHTSAGTVGRVIGFSQTQGFLGHPYMHCAVRRDCDGDEVAIMLLLDAFLNFSRQYLPDRRGGRSMDCCLVLSTKIDPTEIDDQVYNLDVMWSYPLQFYYDSLEWKPFYESKVVQVNDRLGSPEQFFDFGYTHPVGNINEGVHVSSYKTLVTMFDKVMKEMELAEKIRAVCGSDIAQLIIEKHFLRDIKGNLRRYSKQEFRCVNCNAKYRRIPLLGKCLKCSGKIVLTVSEGTVIKYLDPSLHLSEKYSLPAYLRQSLDLLKRMVESVFGRETEKQTGLGDFIKGK